jgi:hypothetical protein
MKKLESNLKIILCIKQFIESTFVNRLMYHNRELNPRFYLQHNKT